VGGTSRGLLLCRRLQSSSRVSSSFNPSRLRSTRLSFGVIPPHMPMSERSENCTAHSRQSCLTGQVLQIAFASWILFVDAPFSGKNVPSDTFLQAALSLHFSLSGSKKICERGNQTMSLFRFMCSICKGFLGSCTRVAPSIRSLFRRIRLAKVRQPCW